MVVHFHRVADDNDEPMDSHTYRRVLEYWADYCTGKGIQNVFWAEIVCPVCRRGAMVGWSHSVSAGGMVSPSFVCTHDGCTFHEMIHLDDWDRPATPRRHN